MSPVVQGMSVGATQGTLGMQSSAAPAAAGAPAAPGAEAAAGAAPAAGAPTPTADGSAPAAAGQAQAGAEQVQPPNTKKIILGSVLRGAVTGASLAFSVNKLGWLVKILNFIPFPPLKAVTTVGTAAALIGGAVIGGVAGLMTGMKSAKKQAASFLEAQAKAAAAAATPAPGDPLVIGPNGQPAGAKPEVPKDVKKNPVMGTKKKKKKARAADGQNYHIKRGDTLWALSRKYGVSIDAIVKANPSKIKDPDLIYAGDTIVIPAK